MVTQVRFSVLAHHRVSASYRHSSPGHMCVTQSLCMRSHRNGCVSGYHVHRWRCREPSRSTPPRTLKNTGRKDGWRGDSAEGRKAKLSSNILRAGFEVSLVNSSPSWCMCVMQLRSGWKEKANDSVGPLRRAPLYLNNACRRGENGGELQKTGEEERKRRGGGVEGASRTESLLPVRVMTAVRLQNSSLSFQNSTNRVKSQHFINNWSLVQVLRSNQSILNVFL